MGFIETVIEKYPKYAIAILFLYGLAATGVSVVTFFYSAYYEAKKPYLTAVFKYCEDVSDTAARIRSAEAYPNGKVEDFQAYYFGRLVIVEDKNLASKMVQYRNVLQTITPQNFAKERENLHNPTLEIAGACRDLIKSTWALSIVPWADVQKPSQ